MKKGSFWHGTLRFRMRHLNLQSTPFSDVWKKQTKNFQTLEPGEAGSSKKGGAGAPALSSSKGRARLNALGDRVPPNGFSKVWKG